MLHQLALVEPREDEEREIQNEGLSGRYLSVSGVDGEGLQWTTDDVEFA